MRQIVVDRAVVVDQECVGPRYRFLVVRSMAMGRVAQNSDVLSGCFFGRVARRSSIGQRKSMVAAPV